MKQIWKSLAGAGAMLGLLAFPAQAQQDTIKIGLLQDHTAVYTFVSLEYNQGQMDYIQLVNQRGGIDGHLIEPTVRDHGNEPQRGIEAYNRVAADGAVMVDFFSTPVSRAMVNRVLDDEIVMITVLHGRGDASDGKTFPYIFPLMATYWSQAALLARYIEDHQGGLAGKRIAFVFIDSPFGREPVPVLQELAEREGFTFQTFPYPSPGTEQSAQWSDVRRFRPDHVILWGAGGGQPVSVREAIRNGIPTDSLLSVVWMAETDMEVVGVDRAVGVKRFEATAPGSDVPVVQEIVEEVYGAGNGHGPEDRVGTSYYNIGVGMMATVVEGMRLGLEEFGAPLTGDKLRRGMEMIRDFDAGGLMPPVSFSEEDHQGGGYGRVSQWNGEAWEPLTDWYTAYQDIVWELVEKDAAEFRESN